MKKAFCVLGMVVTLLLTLLFMGLLAVGVTQTYALSESRDWLTTEAKLTALYLSKEPRGYEARLESIYLVNGETYNDDSTAWMRGEASKSLEAAKRDIAQKLGLKRVKWRDLDSTTHQAILTENNSHVIVSYHPTFPSHAFYAGIYRPELPHQIALNHKVSVYFGVLMLLFGAGFFSACAQCGAR